MSKVTLSRGVTPSATTGKKDATGSRPSTSAGEVVHANPNLIVTRGLQEILDQEYTKKGLGSSSGGEASLCGTKKRIPLGKPPKTVLCYLCGRGFGTTSISIHRPQCYLKQMIAYERGEVQRRPVDPDTHERQMQKRIDARRLALQRGGEEDVVGGGPGGVSGNSNGTRSMIGKSFNAYSDNDWELYNAIQQDTAFTACPHCARTFLPDRLQVHLRSCRPGHTSKPLMRKKLDGPNLSMVAGGDRDNNSNNNNNNNNHNVPRGNGGEDEGEAEVLEVVEMSVDEGRGRGKAGGAGPPVLSTNATTPKIPNPENSRRRTGTKRNGLAVDGVREASSRISTNNDSSSTCVTSSTSNARQEKIMPAGKKPIAATTKRSYTAAVARGGTGGGSSFPEVVVVVDSKRNGPQQEEERKKDEEIVETAAAITPGAAAKTEEENHELNSSQLVAYESGEVRNGVLVTHTVRLMLDQPGEEIDLSKPLPPVLQRGFSTGSRGKAEAERVNVATTTIPPPPPDTRDHTINQKSSVNRPPPPPPPPPTTTKGEEVTGMKGKVGADKPQGGGKRGNIEDEKVEKEKEDPSPRSPLSLPLPAAAALAATSDPDVHHFLPCAHCHRSFDPSRLERHEPVCPERPVTGSLHRTSPCSLSTSFPPPTTTATASEDVVISPAMLSSSSTSSSRPHQWVDPLSTNMVAVETIVRGTDGEITRKNMRRMTLDSLGSSSHYGGGGSGSSHATMMTTSTTPTNTTISGGVRINKSLILKRKAAADLSVIYCGDCGSKLLKKGQVFCNACGMKTQNV